MELAGDNLCLFTWLKKRRKEDKDQLRQALDSAQPSPDFWGIRDGSPQDYLSFSSLLSSLILSLVLTY